MENKEATMLKEKQKSRKFWRAVKRVEIDGQTIEIERPNFEELRRLLIKAVKR